MNKYNIRLSSRFIQNEILEIFEKQKPKLTVRQLYYALVVRGVIPKNENGYRQTCYQLSRMREAGRIPYGWIADNTRWQRKPETYEGLKAAFEHYLESYRRSLWDNQQHYVEVWIEKDALASVISPITAKYDVPLYVCRGYSSQTYLYEAAEFLKELGKPSFIYHFGDYDPSGVDAANKVAEGLRWHGADIHFRRAAILDWQIDDFKLPTRETKRSDPRAKKWGDKPSVELDALPAPVLRGLVQGIIEHHLDKELLQDVVTIENKEKKILAEIGKNLDLVQDSGLGMS